MKPSKTFNMAGLSTSFVVIKNEEMLKRYNNELDSYHLRQGNIFGVGSDGYIQLNLSTSMEIVKEDMERLLIAIKPVMI